MATDEKWNPIKQDTKKGKLRFYGIDPVFNYGCLPQTWEDPNTTHPELQVGPCAHRFRAAISLTQT